jgi:hypothetical protein
VRAELLNQRVRKQNAWQVPLVGALSRTVSGGPLIPDLKNRQTELQPGVARLQPALFPDNPIALEGLDMLYLNTAQALDDKLKTPQVNALLAWLHAGGHLVVGIDQISHVTSTEWLRRVLPCEVTSLILLPKHPELQEWVQGNGRFDGRAYSFEGSPSTAPCHAGPAPPPGLKAATGANHFLRRLGHSASQPYNLKPDENSSKRRCNGADHDARRHRINQFRG